MDELFEVLQKKLNVGYLSDIRVGEMKRKAIRLALEEEPKKYSLQNWNDLLSYLTEEPACDSVEEVRKKLTRQLKRRDK